MPGHVDLIPQRNSYAQPNLACHSASNIIEPERLRRSSVKRKRSQDELPESLLHSIVIKPCPSTYSASLSISPTDEPETFVPIRMLRRSSLPLSSLDSACSLPSRPSSRLFSARPDLLDSLQGDILERGPTVLIVESLADEKLYAIENVVSSRGTYALCRLASWLRKRDIEVLGYESGAKECLNADRGIKSRMTTARTIQLGSEKSDWWHGAAICGVSTEPSTKKRRIFGPMLKMEMPSLGVKVEEMSGRSDTLTKPPSSAPLQDREDRMVKREGLPLPASTVEDPKMMLSVDELTNNLIHHYLDSVYLSRTSLAYFAKGPLSRLRGAAGDSGCALSLLDLTEFLRSAMLTPSLLEKKYKETLPAVIRDVYAFDDDENDGNLATSNRVERQKAGQKKKRRKGKLLKPAKNGLFPEEEEVIRKWWLSRDQSLATDNCNSSSLSPFKSKVEAMKARVAALRLREILAQIIIALEILAIERSSAFRGEGKEEYASRQENVTSDKDNQGGANYKQRRVKKKQDVNLIIDLLVDKLCIWRSVEQQDLSFKGSSRSEHGGPDREMSKTSSPNVSGNTDLLSDFSIEVVVPFYMHRLPEVAVSLSSKLGGPQAPPIPDRRSLKSSATSTLESQNPARPGDPATRQVQLNQRRKIARVASDTSTRYSHPQRPGMGSRGGSAAGNGSSGGIRSRDGGNNGPKRIATLSRSATDTALPMLKCEAENEENELSLASVPPSRRARGAGRDLISSRRQALSQCKRLSQREVDFDAMTKSKVNVLGVAAPAATAASAKDSSKGSNRAAEDGKRLQKSKKIEAVDAQLQDAISAIKKPDRRTAVGKEFEEAVERREVLKTRGKAAARSGISKGREKILPSQHSRGFQQNIQVTATPKHPRASAMMTVLDRNSFGEGQHATTTTRDNYFQSSIPISFSSAQVGANDRSEYRIQNQGQGQGQGQSKGYFAEEEEGFIPSSAVRASTSMTIAQPSLSPLQAISRFTMGDEPQPCISTDTTVANKYSKGINIVTSIPRSTSSLPPTLLLHSSTINGATGNETPTRHPDAKRFGPLNRAHVGEDRSFTAVGATDSSICPDTPASLSKLRSYTPITSIAINDDNYEITANEANNTIETFAAATPVANRVAVLSTRRDNGNARSLPPVVGRRFTFPKGHVSGKGIDGFVRNNFSSTNKNYDKYQDEDEDVDVDDHEHVCAETPFGPGRKQRGQERRQQQQQQQLQGRQGRQGVQGVQGGQLQRSEEKEKEKEETAADILATPLKGQRWDVVGSISAGIAGRKEVSRAAKSARSSETSSLTLAKAKPKAKTKATAMAVVIPVSKSSSYSSSSSACSASLPLHSSSSPSFSSSLSSSSSASSPAAAAAAAAAAAVGTAAVFPTMMAPTSAAKMKTPRPQRQQQQSALFPSSSSSSPWPVHTNEKKEQKERGEEEEEDIYRVLGWDL